MAEATTKEEQSTDGYSKGNKGEKEAKQFYKSVVCWKGGGPDKEKQYGLLASTRNLWHQLIFLDSLQEGQVTCSSKDRGGQQL